MNTNFFLRSFIGWIIVAGANLGFGSPAASPPEQTIAWTGTTNEFLALNSPYPLSATASSGLPVTLRVKSGPAVLIDGKITVNAPGTVWVTAEQTGNEAYAPTSINRAFNLRQAAVSLIGQHSDLGFIYEFVKKGGLLYAANASGLQIFDVTDAAHINLVGKYVGCTVMVKVVENRAYVLNLKASQDVSFDVVDITDPTQPALLGSLPDNGAWGRVFGAMEVAGNIAYLSLDSRILRIDVSNPAAPTIAPENELSNGAVRSMQVVGPLLYLAGDGLSIWDISEPAAPRYIAQYPFWVTANGLKVVGERVYLRSGGDLVILQGDPANLEFLGSTPISQFACALEVSGDCIFIGITPSHGRFEGSPSNTIGGLEVFDGSNPSKIIRVGGYRYPATGGTTVAVSGEAAFAYSGNPDGNGGVLKVLNMTLREPPKPRLEISRPTSIGAILSAPSLPGWQVEKNQGLESEQVDWAGPSGFYGFYEESDGIQSFLVREGFFRMRKVDF